MVTKVEAARIATGFGIPVVLTAAPLAAAALAGERGRHALPPGTRSGPTARLFWLAHATVAARPAAPRPGRGAGGGGPAQVAAAGRDHRGRRRRSPPATRSTWSTPPGAPVARGLVNYDAVELPGAARPLHRGARRGARPGLRTRGRPPRRPRPAVRSVPMSVTGAGASGPARRRSALATATRTDKDAALLAMADALVAAYRRDPRGQRRRTCAAAPRRRPVRGDARPADADRGAGRGDGRRRCAQMAALPDPVGEVVRGSTLPNGLELRQVRVPFGVVGIIYEARPNVTVDAAGICLKSGNAVLLRGSSSARAAPTRRSSRCCATRSPAPACRPTRSSCSTPPRRDSVKELMRARGLVDVLIPRGGAVADPDGGRGVDGAGDRDRRRQLPRLRRRGRRPRQGARDRCSTPRPSGCRVCNTAESLLVHADVADGVPAPGAGGARRRGRHRARRRRGARRTATTVVPATDEDWAHGVPVARTSRPPSSTVAGRGDRPHPPVRHRPHRGDRHRVAAAAARGSSPGSTRPP